MGNGLRAEQLAYQMNDKWLFQDLSFELNPGKLLYVQGTNGAGKTTLLRCLAGILIPSEGKIVLSCQQRLTSSLVYIGHQQAIKPRLTVKENMQLMQTLAGEHNQQRVSQMMQTLQLDHFANRDCQMLSAGQRQKLALSRISLRQAKLWILDEPFNALDNAGSEWLTSIMQQFMQNDGMIVMTSHQKIIDFGKQQQILRITNV